MIKKKRIYMVPEWDEDCKVFSDIIGVWCTNNIECKNMSINDAIKQSVRLNGRGIDESIKDCLIFTFYDAINYAYEADKFVEIKYEELIEICKECEVISNE